MQEAIYVTYGKILQIEAYKCTDIMFIIHSWFNYLSKYNKITAVISVLLSILFLLHNTSILFVCPLESLHLTATDIPLIHAFVVTK